MNKYKNEALHLEELIELIELYKKLSRTKGLTKQRALLKLMKSHLSAIKRKIDAA